MLSFPFWASFPAPGSPLHPGWVWKGAWPVRCKSVNLCVQQGGREGKKPEVPFASWEWSRQPGLLLSLGLGTWASVGPVKVGNRGCLWR